MNELTFYDIHMHAFNLSHPYYRAFLSRFKLSMLLLVGPLTVLVPPIVWLNKHLPPTIARFLRVRWVIDKINGINNLLAVMENDVGSLFLLLEDCLRENGMLDDKGLHIGEQIYTRVVLTPLMMDFGFKGIRSPSVHYKEPCRKPIREQVIDVFDAIDYYRKFSYLDKYSTVFPRLGQGNASKRIFEIYPFIGINTDNYDAGGLSNLFKQYFDDYEGTHDALFGKLGCWDGVVEHLTSNCVAGIKLYPPLGFDPWPDPAKDPDEANKANYLYWYCQKKKIPITIHASQDGFVAVDRKTREKVTSLSKWKRVLEAYPRLKLNLAHFPLNEKFLIFPKKKRLKEVLNLINGYDNVYVDFSCQALSPGYYASLKQLIVNSPSTLREKLSQRVLFGSDFPMHLSSVESYNSYLTLFSKSCLDSDCKERFCSVNPESFLFHS